jgi:hypothetical protein
VTGTRDRVSQLPGYLWLQTDEVVRDGLDAVLGDKPREVTVPGGVYRLLVWISGAFPGVGRWLANRNAHKFRDTD